MGLAESELKFPEEQRGVAERDLKFPEEQGGVRSGI
jgi:hypothetical protein